MTWVTLASKVDRLRHRQLLSYKDPLISSSAGSGSHDYRMLKIKRINRKVSRLEWFEFTFFSKSGELRYD